MENKLCNFNIFKCNLRKKYESKTKGNLNGKIKLPIINKSILKIKEVKIKEKDNTGS